MKNPTDGFHVFCFFFHYLVVKKLAGIFSLELCTSSFFNSCSITEKKPAALETPATKSFSAEINVPMTFLAASSWTPAKLPCRVASWISDAAEQASEVLLSGSPTEQMRVLRPSLVWYEQCLQALFFSFICSFKILKFSYDKPFIFYISWLLLRNTRWSYPLLMKISHRNRQKTIANLLTYDESDQKSLTTATLVDFSMSPICVSKTKKALCLISSPWRKLRVLSAQVLLLKILGH